MQRRVTVLRPQLDCKEIDIVGLPEQQLVEHLTESPEGAVDAVGSVGGRHDDDVRALLEAVHQRQQLRHDAPLHLAVSLHRTTQQHTRQ